MGTEIKKAMELAMQYHRGQTRTGEGGRMVPYYEEHVRKVYEILCREAGIEEEDILIMALLHDTLEDTALTRQQIAEEFGEDIAGQVEYLTRHEGQSFQEYANLLFQKGDDRAVLVKLADRLHNLRTILYIRDKKWIAKKVRQTERDILDNFSERQLAERYHVPAEYLAAQIREELSKIRNFYPALQGQDKIY